jgi:hypothetical protein
MLFYGHRSGPSRTTIPIVSEFCGELSILLTHGTMIQLRSVVFCYRNWCVICAVRVREQNQHLSK